jgi:hypothetical protein
MLVSTVAESKRHVSTVEASKEGAVSKILVSTVD